MEQTKTLIIGGAFVPVKLRYDSEAAVYIAKCPMFDLVTQADTEENAAEAIKNLILRKHG